VVTLRPGICEYFRLRPRGAAQIASEVDEEIALHIELRSQELMAAGLSPEEARAEAERRFGALQRSRLKLQRRAEARERRMNISEWLAGWRQDFRTSARALTREPLLALVIVLTLALGIGANATMFGIIDRLLLRGPAHVVEADGVRRVYVTQRSWEGPVETSAYTGYVVYSLLRERQDLFAGVAAYSRGRGRVGRGETAGEVPLGWATADLFPVLGVQPVLGRFFTADEDRPKQAQRVAVLDHDYWQTEFGGAGDVLGQRITIDDEEFTVIGVAPTGFTGPERAITSVWLPLSAGREPRDDWPTTWNARWLHVVARPQRALPLDLVNEEATRSYRAAAPAARRAAAEAKLSLLPLGYGTNGEEPPEVAVTRWLVGVSVIVLLVACANVMNLLLARAVRRRREVAVRLALGISRARLMRLLLSESLLLALAGGAVAILLAYWGGQFLRAALLPDVRWGAPIDSRVMLFSLLAVIATGVTVGLAPALQTRQRDVTATLKATARQGGTSRSGLRTALTVLQAAFSLVLLIGAGLFVRSLWNVHRLELGIDADRVLAVAPVFPASGRSTEAQVSDLQRHAVRQVELADRLRAHPVIESVALALGTPLQGTFGVKLRVPGRDSIPQAPGGGPFITAASPGYFETVGTRIVRGRGIEAGEGSGTAPIVIVSETMARMLWPGEDALSKCLLIGDDDVPCARVVGIAEDANRFGLRDEPVFQYYIPLGQEKRIYGTQILVRPRRTDAAAFLPELRHRLHALEPGATFFKISVLQQRLDPQIRPWRLGATMFLVFGGLALLIAVVGLYSVVAYGVAQRRTEIGVRMALGARGGTIVGMVLRQGLALVLAGIAIGSALALATGRYLESLLFATSSRDFGTFAAVALTLAVVSVFATVIPALRAGRTDPAEALRAE
jgi:predicted permease